MHAASRYRPGEHSGTPFSAFARPRVHGAIIDSVRRRAWLENTANPLDDARELSHHRAMPFLVHGAHVMEPRRRGLGAPTPFRPDHLPPRLLRALRELTVRQRAILGLLYGDAESTVEQIAAMQYITIEAVIAEHRAALDSLRGVLLGNLSPDGLDATFFLERAA